MNEQKGKKVYVGMSGGVDSSVAALLLKQQGYEVTGVFMRNWHADIHDGFVGDCPWEEDLDDVKNVCAVIDIPYQVWDFSQEYYDEVVEYFFKEYKKGRTPNPDVYCNKYIKFGYFLNKALTEGADYVATGHYARVINGNGFKLLTGLDTNKDQSYFLWTITQKQLSHVIFPIGDIKKPEVRKMAKENKLSTADKKDSQGICFIGDIDVQKFLRSRIKEKVGDILTPDGIKVGEHKGAYFYTQGQREGLNIGGQAVPNYVLSKDVVKNTVTVVPAYDQKLFSSKLTASEVHWIADKEPSFPLSCQARIRYRQKVEPCTVSIFNNILQVEFDNPQRAIAPGQSIVFYKEEECMGGAIID